MRNTEIYVISPEFVRQQSNLSQNIQDKFLNSAIREVTEIDFRNIVGSSLLNVIKSKIEDSSIYEDETLNGLMDISKYFLLYRVIARIIPIVAIKIDNIGLYQSTDEKTTQVKTDDVFKMQEYYTQRSDYFILLIKDYFKNNESYFKQYGVCECEVINGNHSSISQTGVFLGGKRGRRR